MLELCPGVDEPWLWERIEAAPTPAKAANLTRANVEKILRLHRIRRLTAEEIVAQLKVPALRLAPGSVEAASEHVLLLIPRLRMLHQQRKDIAGRIEGVLGQLRTEGERSREHYAELRSKGHTHGRALRGVADRLLAVLIAMLKTGSLYRRDLRAKAVSSHEPAR
jgi:hypothetical protein